VKDLPDGVALAALSIAPVPMAVVNARGETVWTNAALDEVTAAGRVGGHRLIAIPKCEGYFLRIVFDEREADRLHEERNALHTLLLFTDLLSSLPLTGKAAEYVEELVQQAAVLRGE
jgi:hypothetical protein